jgi:hypothetical protein
MTTPETSSGDPTPAPVLAAKTATLPPQQIPSNKPSGFALAALLVGIGAILFGLVPVFGALVGIAALVLGFLAITKQQSKGLAITGMVLGGLAVLSSMGVTLGVGALVNSSSVNRPPVSIAQPVDPSAAPAEEPTPAEETAPAADPDDVEVADVPPEYKSALRSGESYSELMHMSKAGIYGQLTSEYGDQFTPEAAQYAIDNMVADWNANALASAKSYQDLMAMSPAAIHDQLTSEYGDKFSPEEADYAILHLND